jgi:REP element-mobilizing transposase RayT
VKKLPQRKQIRLKGYDYSRNGAYFITFCVKDRAKLLGHIEPDAPPPVPDASYCKLTPYGDVVAKRITEMCRHYENIEIPHYVIMPDHVHMIILVSDNEGNGRSNEEDGLARGKNGMSRTPSPANAVIPAFISTLKRFTNKEVGFSLWQRSFHDHIIRDEREYDRIAKYIENNPQRWLDDRFNAGGGRGRRSGAASSTPPAS